MSQQGGAALGPWVPAVVRLFPRLLYLCLRWPASCSAGSSQRSAPLGPQVFQRVGVLGTPFVKGLSGEEEEAAGKKGCGWGEGGFREKNRVML